MFRDHKPGPFGDEQYTNNSTKRS